MTFQSVTVQIPGTCGEWIQTVSEGRECLVSLPVNCYTEVTACFAGKDAAKESQRQLMPKSKKALAVIGNYLDLSPENLSKIAVKTSQTLAIGKGMASSTADLLGVMSGVALLHDAEIPPETLLRLCCQIEASDGLMFGSWTLIDHLRGLVLESYGTMLPADILMLIPDQSFITEKLRATTDYAEKIKVKTDEPLKAFRAAIEASSLKQLGRAATLSLTENEAMLKKPFLEELIELSDKFSAHGIVGAHSGTVIGFVLDSQKTDCEALANQIKQLPLGQHYNRQQLMKTVKAGVARV